MAAGDTSTTVPGPLTPPDQPTFGEHDDPPGRIGRWRARRPGLSPILGSSLILVMGALVLPPLVAILLSSVRDGRTLTEGSWTLEHFRSLVTVGDLFPLLRRTLVFGLTTSLVVVGAGSVIAWLLERTNAPFRRFTYFSMIAGFTVPTVIHAMGWVLLAGRNGLFNSWLRDIFGEGVKEFPLYSMTGLVFVQALALLPPIFLLLTPAFRFGSPALEEAALVSGASRWRVLKSISLPLALPSILGAFLLALIFTIESFEVPALIGTPGRVSVVSTAIFGRLRRTVPDYGGAAAMGFALMAITVVALVGYQRATRHADRFATITGRGFQRKKQDLGRMRHPAGLLILLVDLALLAPVAVLVWASFLPNYVRPSAEALGDLNLQNYRDVLNFPAVTRSITNTFIVGGVSAVAVMVLAFATSWVAVRHRSRSSQLAEQIANLPLAIPGVVLSLALLRLYLSSPIPIYGTLAALMFALCIHYVPVGQRYTSAAVLAQRRDLEEAAILSGASRLRSVLRITAPLALPSIAAGALFILIAAFRQVSVVVFLTSPGNEVTAMQMFSMWTVGNFSTVAAFAVMVTVLLLVVTAVVNRFSSGGQLVPEGN